MEAPSFGARRKNRTAKHVEHTQKTWTQSVSPPTQSVPMRDNWWSRSMNFFYFAVCRPVHFSFQLKVSRSHRSAVRGECGRPRRVPSRDCLPSDERVHSNPRLVSVVGSPMLNSSSMQRCFFSSRGESLALMLSTHLRTHRQARQRWSVHRVWGGEARWSSLLSSTSVFFVEPNLVNHRDAQDRCHLARQRSSRSWGNDPCHTLDQSQSRCHKVATPTSRGCDRLGRARLRPLQRTRVDCAWLALSRLSVVKRSRQRSLFLVSCHRETNNDPFV